MSEKTSGKPELNLQTVAQKLGVNFDRDKLLVTASQKGEFDCVEFLVKNGANVHARNDEALRSASMNGHFEVASFLKDNSK